MVPGARTGQRVEAFQRLGCDVTIVETNRPGATYEDMPGLLDRLRYRFRRPADKGGADSAICSLATASPLILPGLSGLIEDQGFDLARRSGQLYRISDSFGMRKMI